MQIVERKPVPIYEVTCFECGSTIRYQASEVNYSHITCPVCRTLLWAMTLNPVTYEDVEPTEEEPSKVTSNYDLLHQKKSRADRIRAKSDEELATWVEAVAGCDLCPMLDEQCSGGEVNSRASCKRHWLEWLRQEAEE